MKAVQFAIVPEPAADTVRHFRGMPPLATSDADRREPMDPARVVIAAAGEAGYYLYRLDAQGDAAGDTWHLTLADVKHQALVEYSLGVDAWLSVPDQVSDLTAAVEYVMQQANSDKGLNSSG